MDEIGFQQNERDIEIPLLFACLRGQIGLSNKLLDVGCMQSLYLPVIRKMIGVIHGIDLLSDYENMKYLDKFFKEDFLTAELPSYDLIISVSAIEHIGVEYLPTPLYREYQMLTIQKIINLSKRALFLTFPYGEDIFVEGHYYQHNKKSLNEIKEMLKETEFEITFWSTSDRRKENNWHEIPQDLADKATNELSGGGNTICVIEAYKRG